MVIGKCIAGVWRGWHLHTFAGYGNGKGREGKDERIMMNRISIYTCHRMSSTIWSLSVVANHLSTLLSFSKDVS